MSRLGTAMLAALLLVPATALAQAGEPPEREASLVVYGDDPCPTGEDEEEIVVCARRPETERYRVPKEFREDKDRRGSVAWGSRFQDLEEDTRFTRPNSCSVVGAGGQTGCLSAMIRQWYAERRARGAR